ncbi:MAG: DUF5979 domain-containing protein [Eubacterium sp.]|nr:DUF5979 domain-containing protein [Eubacterium sp.]
MKFKEFKRLLKSAAVTLVTTALCFGAVSPALAAPVEGDAFTFTKTIEMDKNVDLPNDLTFTYAVAPTAPAPADAFTIDNVTAANFGTPTTVNRLNTYTVNRDIQVDVTKFTHAGSYTYTVTETDNYTDTATKTLSTKEGTPTTYTVEVVIANDDTAATKLKVDRIAISSVGATEKSGAMSFASQLEKTTSTNDGNELTVTKRVSGDYADKEHAYKFTFKITGLAALEAQGATYSVATTPSTESLTAAIGVGDSFDFYLKDGESITISNLPVGTQYEITEDLENIQNAGSYVTTLDNTTLAPTDITYTANTKTASGALDDVTNSITYINALNNITPTGLFIDNLPYLLLAAIGAAGIAFYMVSRRRQYQG